MSDSENGSIRPLYLAMWSSVLAAPILTMLGLHQPAVTPAINLQTSPSAEQTAEAAKPDAVPPQDDDAPEPKCLGRFLNPLGELLRSTPGRPPIESPRNWAAAKGLRDRYAPSFDVMIALLPDPVDSGLGYAFDSQLQALRLGLETKTSTGGPYQRLGDWLPWNDRHVPSEERARSSRCRYEVPGFLLYQRKVPERNAKAGDPNGAGQLNELMLVLVVGESAMTGPHTGALRRAIQLAAPGEGPKNADRAKVRVLGPSFSGSAEALRGALGHQGRRATIVSPTANGPAVSRTLNNGEIDFASTTAPQSALECAFLRFAARGEPRDQPNEVLSDVAILSESNTSFGQQDTTSSCRHAPALHLTFPQQISALSTEYERADGMEQPAPAGRRTMLDVRLLGSSGSDVDTQLSSATKYAQDHALANLLSRISREGIRFLGIRATNIADAIFLARKVRDVAPDVRLAFFESDALLLHPEYQRHLFGSLVVSSYPFLGADDFSISSSRPHAHHPFESGAALATFNAVLALRGAAASELREYVYPEAKDKAGKVLPVWLSAVGRSGLTPVRMTAAVDCDRTIYKGDPTPDPLCKSGGDAKERRDARRAFNDFGLNLSAAKRPVPNLWYFVLAFLSLVAVLDFASQRRMICALGHADRSEALPFSPGKADRELDLLFAAAQWRWFAFLRRLCLLIAAAYMALIHHLAPPPGASTFLDPWLTVLLAVIPVLLIGPWAMVGLARCLETFASFRRVVRSLPSTAFPATRGRSLLAWLGLGVLFDRSTTIQRSYAHLLTTFVVCLAVTVLFVVGLGDHLRVSANFDGVTWTWPDLLPRALADQGIHLQSKSQLFILRSMHLLSGLSPMTPLLLCLTAIYVWAVGRCARTALLRSLSTMSPTDDVLDGVSTPLCSVLFPEKEQDGGFVRQERSLVNALSRPSGSSYVVTLAVIAVLPVVLFTLKRPSTLESHTGLMFAALGIMAVVAGITLLQLLQYFRALDLVLKRIMAHPLGPAFQRVQPPVREGIDAQVSRFPNDLLRMVGCAQSFETLVVLDRPTELAAGIDLHEAPTATEGTADGAADVERLPRPPLLPGTSTPVRKHLPSEVLDATGRRLARACDDTLAAMSGSDVARQATQQAKLGTALVTSARTMMEILSAARKGVAIVSNGRAPLRLPSQPPPSDAPSTSSVASWLMRVESYVATVVALLLNRHIRQFRIFLYTAVSCAVLLLLAIASYPFEPHRTLLTCILLVMGAVVCTCMYVFVQLDRDPLLNQIAGTPDQAGHLTWNSAFLMRVVLWVVIPLLSVLAAQYPELAHDLAGSVEPFARALR